MYTKVLLAAARVRISSFWLSAAAEAARDRVDAVESLVLREAEELDLDMCEELSSPRTSDERRLEDLEGFFL